MVDRTAHEVPEQANAYTLLLNCLVAPISVGPQVGGTVLLLNGDQVIPYKWNKLKENLIS